MTRLRLFTLLACLAGVLLVPGSGQAVIGGEPDTDHPYVGLVASANQVVCSGSLVSSTIFVTAAHCFSADGVQAKVRFGSTVSPSTPFTTGTVHIHPGFCFTCGPGFTDDLAVVELNKKVRMSKYGKLPALGTVDTLPEQADIVLVGYGVSEFVRGQGTGAFSRLTAVAMLKKKGVTENHIQLTAKKDGAACFGDSGGPNLLPGTDTIVAVNSFGTNNRCTASSYSYRLDTPAAQGFLSQFLP